MNGIDKIIEKVRASAKAEADGFMENAKAQEARIIGEAREKAARGASEALAKAEEQAEQMKKRIVSVGELEARKLRLGARQEAVDVCFTEALNRLSTMERGQYISMLASMAAKAIKADTEVLLNSTDRAEIGEKLVEEISSRLSNTYKVTLSDETISARGGFVLKSGKVEINYRLETLVKSIREELVPKVVEVLFD